MIFYHMQVSQCICQNENFDYYLQTFTFTQYYARVQFSHLQAKVNIIIKKYNQPRGLVRLLSG